MKKVIIRNINLIKKKVIKIILIINISYTYLIHIVSIFGNRLKIF